ncbi:MAG TPA: alpha/beta hydrolase [Burkholderiales bacterium]|nr:alpha/beta hydrolase [Burkholderiales bacterium]
MTDLQAASSTSHFIEANGVKLHYLDYGTAGRRPMLCLHGGAAHAHWFDFVAPGLTPDHHVLSLDLRGHGDSAWAEQHTYAWKTYAADVNALVEKLDLRDFVLIGHSMGGMVSLVYASTYPGRVGRLVVVDSIMLMPMERVTRMRAYGEKPASSYATQEDLIARYRLEGAEQQMAAPEVLRRMAVHSGKQDADGKWRHKADRRVYANFSQIAGVPLWERVKIPALVVRGGADSKRFTSDTVAEVRAKAPQVQVTAVPESDHHVTLDNPQGFIAAVRNFLAA